MAKDQYTQEEIPTRPDWPTTTAARHCKFCGLVFGEHIKIKGTRERLCPNTKTKYDSGTITVTTSGSNGRAQIAMYRNVALTSFIENVNTATSTSTTLTMPTVGAVGGNHRLAVCGVFSNAGLNGMSSATGESGGNWVESAAEWTSGIGFGIQLQHATLDSGGTISGGTLTVTGSSSACLAGFALVGV